MQDRVQHKPGSQSIVKAALEISSGSLPKILETKSKSSLDINSEKVGHNSAKMMDGSSATITAKPGVTGSTIAKPAAGNKKDDINTSPLLQVNNLKNQRMIGEQKY